MVLFSRGRNPQGRDTHLLLIYLDRILEAEKVKLKSLIYYFEFKKLNFLSIGLSLPCERMERSLNSTLSLQKHENFHL